MAGLRASTLLALLCSLSPIAPAAAQVPDVLRGTWMPLGGPNDLTRLSVGETGAVIQWHAGELKCVMTSQAAGLPPSAGSVTFRCETPGGPVQLGVAATAGGMVLIYVVSPDAPAMRVLVLGRPKEAAPIRPPEAIPQFPMPPPQWTLRTVLPGSLGVAAAGEPLGAVFDRLREAMRRAQISEWTVYGIGADGFALVARMEHIDDSGRPATDRWADSARRRPFSIGDYIQALFSARPGRYRVIAFLVTAENVVAGPAPPDRAAIERLWQGGAGDLPASVRATTLPLSGRVEALVYEFFRPSEDDVPVEVTNSRLTMPMHLSGAGLWRIEELSP